MKRLSTPKRMFTFTVGDGPEVYSEKDLDQFPHIIPVFNNWLESEKSYEREWRNYEYALTDPMVTVPDYTYGGVTIRGSQYEKDLLEYRRKLKDYNLTTEERPNRPDWLKIS